MNAGRHGRDVQIREEDETVKLESMKQKSVVMGDSKTVFSVGCAHALLKDPDMLRELISKADERMYEEKNRCRNHEN